MQCTNMRHNEGMTTYMPLPRPRFTCTVFVVSTCSQLRMTVPSHDGPASEGKGTTSCATRSVCGLEKLLKMIQRLRLRCFCYGPTPVWQ